MDKSLKFAAIASIISLILYYPTKILAFMSITGKYSFLFSILFVLCLIILLVSNIVYMRGFLIIGQRLKNYTLFAAASILIVIGCINILFKNIGLLYFNNAGIIFTMVFIVPFIVFMIIQFIGFIYFIEGLFRLKQKFGRLATAAGIVNLMAFFLIALALVPMLFKYPLVEQISFFILKWLNSFVISIISTILEVSILFKAAKILKLKKETTIKKVINNIQPNKRKNIVRVYKWAPICGVIMIILSLITIIASPFQGNTLYLLVKGIWEFFIGITIIGIVYYASRLIYIENYFTLKIDNLINVFKKRI